MSGCKQICTICSAVLSIFGQTSKVPLICALIHVDFEARARVSAFEIVMARA